MNLDEFLTQGLIESLQNGLIAPELITVYAGNYLAKSLITTDEMAEVQNAVTAYNTAQTSTTDSTSASTSESASASTSESTSESTNESTSTSESTSESASDSTSTAASETATN